MPDPLQLALVVAAARPALVRCRRQGSGAAMVALGLGVALARRPAG